MPAGMVGPGGRSHTTRTVSIDLVEMRSLLERAGAEGRAKEILRALEPKGQGSSSLEQRFEVLRRYWHCFSDLHATQTVQRSSLWGLVDERRERRNSPNVVKLDNTAYENPYHNRLWETLLPKELQADIQRLWRLNVDPKQASEPLVEHFPQALMAETFGPALYFWHGCALTAWFVAEGPRSRTSLSSIGTYYRALLTDLNLLRCPVDPSLLPELAATEIAQGPPVPVTTMFVGRKTGGFDRYRDIITRYRDSWAAAYLDSYLNARLQAELVPVVDLMATFVRDKGRLPTVAQVVRQARHVIDHWLGGDASAVCELFPSPSPRKTQVEPEGLRKHSYRKAATTLRTASEDPPWLRFALIGGPPAFHVHSREWATAAFNLADRILKIERRFMPQVFGFVIDFDHGSHGQRAPERPGRPGDQEAHRHQSSPIREVIREVTGVWPKTERRDSFASPSRKETFPSRPPRRGRWYIGRRPWTSVRRPPVVYIFNAERVLPGAFEEVARDLWNAALRNRVPPPLIVIPDGGGGRPFAAKRDCERDCMSQFLPSEFVQVPLKAMPSVQLTSVVLETGRRVPAQTFDAALRYLERQHGTALTVWDVLNDPLLCEVAVSAAGERSRGHED